MDNITKALALARLGVRVFPVNKRTGRPIIPKDAGGRGFYDATSDDIETIATWFTLDYDDTQAAVGYWTGGSGLFVCDIDRGKKNGKNGFQSIKARDLPVGETHSYRTKSGGEHRVFQTTRTDLTLSEDHDGLEGVDIRAGGSYAVWWANEVPSSRDAFSSDIPTWMVKPVVAKSEFSGEGFPGTVDDWLNHLPDDALPSSGVRDLLDRIPTVDFGHNEMVDLVWGLVRLGSERETGIRFALNKLRSEWLRGQYDTPDYRRDFNSALLGAINKGGRVQKPVPTMLSLSESMAKAVAAGVSDELKALERTVSETATEIDLARVRRGMFKACASGKLSPGAALGIVAGSRSLKNSVVSIESAWFGDGEPSYHSLVLEEEEEEVDPEQAAAEKEAAAKAELVSLMNRLSRDSQSFTFLSEAERSLVEGYEWWGQEYLDWVKTRLKHFNTPYHVATMWAVLSTITSPWGKMPLQGHKPTDCNLYVNVLGDSSSGKSEAWGFGKAMIDAFYGTEHSPIVGDTKKTSAISLHRTLVLRDGEPSLVYSDEVQGFFQDLQSSHWQGSILADLSDYYGGEVPPKNTINDKDISGKRAKSLLTTYFTGIADMSLDAISLDNWRSGFFYRFLWGFGHPRKSGDFDIKLEVTASSYTATMEAWAKEFKRVGALQETRWGPGRIVMWEDDALKRMSKFNEQIDEAVRSSPLYDTVFVPANGRFLISIMKCATIVALSEAAEKVTLRHVLIAISFAGPWHKSMVLAVSETGKDIFEREVEKCLLWIRRNATHQLGRRPWIQRSAVMRAFKPNESAERMLRQLVEEGWLLRSGDAYELMED